MSKLNYYGVLEQHQINDDVILQAAEEITNLGYTVIDLNHKGRIIPLVSSCPIMP